MITDKIETMFSEGFEFVKYFDYIRAYEERSTADKGWSRPDEIWQEFREYLHCENAPEQFAQCYSVIVWIHENSKRENSRPTSSENSPDFWKKKYHELTLMGDERSNKELKLVASQIDWFNRKEIVSQKWGADAWELRPLRYVAYEYMSNYEDSDPIDVIVKYREKLFYASESNRKEEGVRLPSSYVGLFVDVALYIESKTGVPVGTVVRDYHSPELEDAQNEENWREIGHDLLIRSLKCPHGIFEQFPKHFLPANPEDLVTVLTLPYGENPDPKGRPMLSGQLVAEMFSHSWALEKDNAQEYRDAVKNLEEAISTFFKKFKQYRITRTAGRLSRNCYGSLLTDIAWTIYEQDKLFQSDFDALRPDVLVLFAALFEDQVEQLIIMHDYTGNRWESYNYLITELWGEDYYQLGNALLAFYIVAAVIDDADNLDEVEGLFELIKKGMGLPGHTGLKQSIRIVKRSLRANDREDLYLKFDQFDSEQDRLKQLISHGESKTCEFKETLAYCVREKTKRTSLVNESLKAIAAFLNTDGGTLFVGVSDNGEIVGLEGDLSVNKNSTDQLLRLLADKIKAEMGASATRFINYKIEDMDGKKVLVVECEKSDEDIWVRNTNFYIRTVAQSLELKGKQVTDYVRNHFS